MFKKNQLIYLAFYVLELNYNFVRIVKEIKFNLFYIITNKAQ